MPKRGFLREARQSRLHFLSNLTFRGRPIAWDFDETIAPTMAGFVDYHNVEYGTNFTYDSLADPVFWANFGLSERVFMARLADYYRSPFMLPTAPFDDTVETIVDISRHSGTSTMHVVTALPYELGEFVYSYLDRYVPPRVISDVHHIDSPAFRSYGSSKGAVCRKIGAPILVDENPLHIMDCAQHGVAQFIPQRPWNARISFGGPTLIDVLGIPNAVIQLSPLNVSPLGNVHNPIHH